ncbi:type II toxin-antitoxin system VapB family antitoxin [Inquilinus sp. NPDC058860]|uniref:type II toxin-antitoxin system VapB family antitoxin n=1 Tax=Inquilinus sp. NPDC058860 TaxID=3346652 RepID=UPI0036C877BF
MSLYVRDDDVRRLAERLKEATGAKTVTDAVRSALLHELERVARSAPLSARIDKALALADAMGPMDPGFDEKAFTDRLWEGL